MSKWKLLKQKIRNAFQNAIPTYELDYNHVFVKINNNVVYDLNTNKYLEPQTGLF